jgi:single-strand DNA-binding protein
MTGYNKVILAGNLTRDPELRYTPKGTAIAQFGLAINRTWTSESGEKKEDVTFVEVEAWGRQAEVLGQFLRKGRPLLMEGRLRLDQWEDKTTHQKQSRLRVVLTGFTFIDSKGPEAPPVEPGPPRPAAAPAAAAAPPPPTPPVPEPEPQPPEEDDVPF